jgi:putative aminopeptidase FrvX
MRPASLDFFRRLLAAPGPNGDERQAARVWREYAQTFSADVRVDAVGSSWATVGGGGAPRIIAMGHVDEIALVVSHVDDDGFVWFTNAGGWDGNVLPGQRVRILTAEGIVLGVVGKKAIHNMTPEEREKAPKLKDLWIDIGARSGDEARGRVRTGDLAVLDQPVVDLGEGRLASRACDNRAGAFVAVEAARLLAEDGADVSFTAVASVGEETNFLGAYTSAYALEPDAAIVIDVTNATDFPSTDKHENGDVRLGRGPSITRGSGVHRALTDVAIEAAASEGIPLQLEPPIRGNTHTDADAVQLTRAGVPVVVTSVPLRYMHSPNETLELADLEQCAQLVAAIARRVAGEGVPTLE